jgi:threonine/homoserine/homoserine lactone efflux protein
MSGLLPAAALFAATAITPGPNNLIVLNAARDRGLAASARCIAGVVAGSMALLAICSAGALLAGHVTPWVILSASFAGEAYLAYLGLRLLMGWQGGAKADSRPAQAVVAIAAFQFLNPKAWILISTLVASTVVQGGWPAVPLLAVLVAAISAACLILWALGGAVLTRLFGSGSGRRSLDRIMGAMLMAAALIMFITEAAPSKP